MQKDILYIAMGWRMRVEELELRFMWCSVWQYISIEYRDINAYCETVTFKFN